MILANTSSVSWIELLGFFFDGKAQIPLKCLCNLFHFFLSLPSVAYRLSGPRSARFFWPTQIHGFCVRAIGARNRGASTRRTGKIRSDFVDGIVRRRGCNQRPGRLHWLQIRILILSVAMPFYRNGNSILIKWWELAENLHLNRILA